MSVLRFPVSKPSMVEILLLSPDAFLWVDIAVSDLMSLFLEVRRGMAHTSYFLLYGSRDGTQGFMHTTQMFYNWATSYIFSIFFSETVSLSCSRNYDPWNYDPPAGAAFNGRVGAFSFPWKLWLVPLQHWLERCAVSRLLLSLLNNFCLAFLWYPLFLYILKNI